MINYITDGDTKRAARTVMVLSLLTMTLNSVEVVAGEVALLSIRIKTTQEDLVFGVKILLIYFIIVLLIRLFSEVAATVYGRKSRISEAIAHNDAIDKKLGFKHDTKLNREEYRFLSGLEKRTGFLRYLADAGMPLMLAVIALALF